jgi:SnoaL-like protein
VGNPIRRKEKTPISAEANKALVRRFYEEIDKGNLDAMDELVDPDYLDHNPPPFPGLPLGRDGLKQAFKIGDGTSPSMSYMPLTSRSSLSRKCVSNLDRPTFARSKISFTTMVSYGFSAIKQARASRKKA